MIDYLPKLYKFQEEDMSRMEDLKNDKDQYRILLSNEMGLGKGLQCVKFIYDHWLLRPVLAVVPATLRWQWQSEAWDHYRIKSEILLGMDPAKQPRPRKVPLYIISYDVLEGWLDFILELKPKLLILEECHMVKTTTAKRSRISRKLSRRIPNMIGVSGSPLTSRPSELWSILNMLRRDLYPSFMPFAWAYCSPKIQPWGMDFRGAENLDRLHKRLTKRLMIRRLKRDVMKDLPPKLRSVIPMEINQKSRKEYDHAQNDFISWLVRYNKGSISTARRAEGLVQMGYLKRLSAELKMPATINWIEEFLEESDEKLIVFGIHKKILHGLEDRFPNICVRVDGSITGRKRHNAIKHFVRDKKCRLFFGNINAAGVGWSAKGVSNVSFVELPWTPGECTQAEDRVHGIGRGGLSAANIWYLVTRGTIEESLCQIIQKKQIILDTVLDGSKQYGSLNIHRILKKHLLRKRIAA